MYEVLNTVTVGEKEWPIKCNIAVLAYIQDTFGTISAFERKLIGVIPVLDATGNMLYKEDGSLVYKQTDPSISAIQKVAPLMLREGIYQANSQGEDFGDEWEESFQNFDFDLYEMALALNEEFKRCFYRKKKTMKKKPMNQNRKKSSSAE